MASSFTPWLDQDIAIALHLAANWLREKAVKKPGHRSSSVARDWAALYQDNGSCLDIFESIPPAHGRKLQIIKKYPLTLTDGAATIEATPTTACHQDFYACHRKPISQVPLNSFVAVRNFTIRYTSYGPPPDKLRFLLDAIDWLGDGKTIHSEELPLVASCCKVSVAVRELEGTRLEHDSRCFLTATVPEEDEMTPPVHRDDDGADRGINSSNTQPAYGTQMIQAPRHRADDNVQFLASRSMEPVLASNTRREELRPDTTALETDASKQITLLSLLSSNRGKVLKPLSTRSDNEPALTPAISKSSEVEVSVVAMRNLHSVDGQDDGLRQQNDTAQSILSRSGGRNGTKPATQERSRDENQSRHIETTIEQPPMTDQHSDTPPYTDLDGDSTSVREPQWLKGVRPTNTSAKPGLKQNTLLMRADCWQKPQASHQFPDANVPIRILRALKDFAKEKVPPSASSPIISDNGNDSLTDSESIADMHASAESDLPTSEDSWPPSPSPEPPHLPLKSGLALPPDSSLDDGTTSTSSALPRQGTSAPARQPVVVASSNEHMTVEPPSSPPRATGGNDSDEDMEIEVPRGLGEDLLVKRVFAPTTVQASTVVQVKETPYAKGKTGNSVLPTSPQTSSGSPQETSSTSIIYGTYKEPRSSGEGQVIGAGIEPQKVAAAPIVNVMRDSEASSQLPKPAEPAQARRHVHFPFTGTKDVIMADAPSALPCLPQSPRHPRQASVVKTEDLIPNAARPEPTPISAQIPPVDLSSSGENVPSQNIGHEQARTETSEQIKILTNALNAAHTKRKLDNSPSKKSNRQSKRRELRIPDSTAGSQIRDTAAGIRQSKRESMERFREEQRSIPESTSRTSRNGAVERGALLPSVQAGAEIRQLPIARTPYSLIGDSRPEPGLVSTPIQQGIAQHEVDAINSVTVVAKRNAIQETLDHAKTGTKKNDTTEARNSMEGSRQTETHTINRLISPEQGQHPPIFTAMDMDMDAYPPDQIVPLAPLQEAPKPPSKDSRDFAPTSKFTSTTLTDLSKPGNIFQTFKATYPEYDGDAKHFMGQCKQMYRLDLEDKMVPKWQWDDFVIRNRTDYKSYASECLDRGEDVEPYHRFYKDNIRDTLYKKSVLECRRSLSIALEELGANASTMKTPAAPATSVKKMPRRSLPLVSKQQIEQRANDVQSFAAERPRHSLPVASHKLPAPFAGGSTLARRPLPKSSPTPTPSSRAAAASTSRKGTSITTSRTPRQSFNGSAFSASHASTESSDEIRDYYFAHQRTTALTGSTEVDPKLNWPHNLAVRSVPKIPRRYDVLEWKDEL